MFKEAVNYKIYFFAAKVGLVYGLESNKGTCKVWSDSVE